MCRIVLLVNPRSLERVAKNRATLSERTKILNVEDSEAFSGHPLAETPCFQPLEAPFGTLFARKRADLDRKCPQKASE